MFDAELQRDQDRRARRGQPDQVGAPRQQRERQRQRDGGDLDDQLDRAAGPPYRPQTENGEPRLAW